jgi:agmatine deiminase
LDELEKAVTQSGEPLTLVPLPVTEARVYSTRNTSTAPPFESVLSLGLYINYYVANNVVLVPVYGDVFDAVAQGIIAEHFPGRDIVGIPAQLVAELGGMMHCVTQQQPAIEPKTHS